MKTAIIWYSKLMAISYPYMYALVRTINRFPARNDLQQKDSKRKHICFLIHYSMHIVLGR
jgi:hypothetical protein